MTYNLSMVDNGGSSRRTGRRGLWIVAGIAAMGAVAAVMAIWHLPARMYPDAGDAEARAALQSGLLTAAAALTAVAGGLIALDETRQANSETRRANRDTHVRELYATAIGLLSAETIDSRLGGIYGLERVARDSADDQRTVVEVLSAFVREHTRPSRAPLARRPLPGRRWGPHSADPGPRVQRPTTDVHAALTVLARLPHRDGRPRAELTGAHLAGVRLPEANLAGARLDESDLTDTWLSRTNFAGAWLHGANLTGAWLDGALLTRAELSWADLTNAELSRADFTHAWLDGANLTGVKGLTQEQVNSARGDERTRLPSGLMRPASWGPEGPGDEG